MIELLAAALIHAAPLDRAEASSNLVTSMPACCYSPHNQYDLRCAGSRFSWGPGTSSSDPGTWGPRYNPWDGQCQNYSGSAYQTSGWHHNDDPQPVQCKEYQGIVGNRVCRYGDGSITSCVVSGLPTFGPPCQPVTAALPPGFWN